LLLLIDWAPLEPHALSLHAALPICGQPRRRVEQAGPRHHEGGAEATAGARVAVGHVGGGLLVPRGDEAHALVAQPRQRPVELHAGQAEHDLDAFANELPGERFTAGHPWHGLIAPFIDSHYLLSRDSGSR